MVKHPRVRIPAPPPLEEDVALLLNPILVNEDSASYPLQIKYRYIDEHSIRFPIRRSYIYQLL